MSGLIGRLKSITGRSAKAPAGSPLVPDRPVEFGYKVKWLASRTEDTMAVADALNLHEPKPSTWAEGIDRAYAWSRRKDGVCFITPPIQGWTLAVGLARAIPEPSEPNWLPWLASLSERLGHVQYYCTHRVVELHAWARAEQGRIVRAYAYVGESGKTLVNIGDPTPDEIELGFRFFDESQASVSEIEAYWAKINEGGLEEAAGSLPDEESVMSLAGRWSLDPTRLDEYESEPGLGLIGTLRGHRKAGWFPFR